MIRGLKVNDFSGTLFLWPKTAAGKRLAARFDHKGELMAAGILSHWPDVENHKQISKWCETNLVQIIQKAGLNIPPLQAQQAKTKVDPSLHWRHCDQSASMWWPFYKVSIHPVGKAAQTVFVDLAHRVYAKLTGS